MTNYWIGFKKIYKLTNTELLPKMIIDYLTITDVTLHTGHVAEVYPQPLLLPEPSPLPGAHPDYLWSILIKAISWANKDTAHHTVSTEVAGGGGRSRRRRRTSNIKIRRRSRSNIRSRSHTAVSKIRSRTHTAVSKSRSATSLTNSRCCSCCRLFWLLTASFSIRSNTVWHITYQLELLLGHLWLLKNKHFLLLLPLHGRRGSCPAMSRDILHGRLWTC